MLAAIPRVEDLAADPVTHHFDDMVAPSGLTNFLGTVRVDHDLTAISAVQFPPVSQAITQTAVLFVDGRLFASYGVPVTHQWRPDRVVRTAAVDGWEISTTTVAAPGQTAVVIEVAVRNTGDEQRRIRLSLSIAARVTRAAGAWRQAESPSERDDVEIEGRRLVFRSAERGAWNMQGVDVPAHIRLSGVTELPDAFGTGIGGNGRGGEIAVELTVPAGGTGRFGYVNATGTTSDEADASYRAVIADVAGVVAEAERFWNRQLAAAFTPGNGEYSGHLPTLETQSPALRRLYWWSILGVIWFRRDFVANVLGRSYDTLMPNYWGTTTFIWDYSLSSLTHALLDPEEMRRQVSLWIGLDTHTHFGTSSLTGETVGNWYSVNDFAMTRLVNDYVRVTGNTGFLRERIGERGAVTESLRYWALAWHDLRTPSGLADYGEIDNLLECVSSYTHEVASLNAANVWNLRTVAALLDQTGDTDAAAGLRGEAEDLLPRVLGLAVEGEGFFAAGQPDGTRLPVRHCYDFSIVGTTIPQDLPAEFRADMVSFFQRELQSENWMGALSPWDPDASYSVRPDHQWNGAYPAWPADAGRALIALGAPQVLLSWLDGLARSANQGPMGQAHFVEDAVPGINGGARKAPPQLPYIIDWSCSSSGAWFELIVEGIFGVRIGVDGAVTAGGCIQDLDPTATLRNLRVAERLFDIHADGSVVDSPLPPTTVSKE
ncbi:hypothetical protein [Microbacterium jiangjiandongii]|uniref:hypothetical protein n=1 Tax=Microbacterium jiangjiandongii TaxID=3049071 RepID=UPI00214A9597|nr:hypothetical protein [Microbacterium sp. zg.Y843]MCR2815781.1 hypothetical protein [Microbacterium sp. zg.Y843]